MEIVRLTQHEKPSEATPWTYRSNTKITGGSFAHEPSSHSSNCPHGAAGGPPRARAGRLDTTRAHHQPIECSEVTQPWLKAERRPE